MVRRVLITICLLIAGVLALPSVVSAAPVLTTAAQRTVAADIAVQQVGDKYERGSAGPDAFDCSGLTTFAFTGAGFDLGVRSSQAMAKLGATVRRAAIKKGDLVFTWDKKFGHVGIAISPTQYVHAPGAGRAVAIAPIPAGSALISARRP